MFGIVVLLFACALGFYNYSFVSPEYDYYSGKIEYWEYTVYPFVGLAVMFAIYGFATFIIPWLKSTEEVNSWWWVPPIYFSLIGGLISYVAIKDRDKERANQMLAVGCLSSILAFFVGIAYILTL